MLCDINKVSIYEEKMNLVDFHIIKKYGRGHPIKGGSLHPKKLRPTLIEMLLAHLYTSKKFWIHKLTPSCRKTILINFTCIIKGGGRRQRQIDKLKQN